MVGLENLIPRYAVSTSGILGGKACYTPEDIHAAMEATLYGTASVWPSAKGWIEVAQNWASIGGVGSSRGPL